MKEIETLPRPLKLTIKLKRKNIDSGSLTNDDPLDNGKGECSAPNSSSLHQEDSSSSKIDNNAIEDKGILSPENNQYQLVLYDPSVNGVREAETVPDHISYGHLSFPRPHPFSNRIPRVLPSIGSFTVQCAKCFKWRLIPTKEKYEEIRAHIMRQPFVCESAREWRPEISCNDAPDIKQDGSRLWAIDKPSIAQPPPGWQRLLRIRGEGSSKFADVYYVAPSGKRLRSMVEIQRYLNEHPECIGVHLSQFSFQIPRPLQENYVRKRSACTAPPNDCSHPGMPQFIHPSEVKPISWVSPEVDTDLHLSGPTLPSPEIQSSKRKRPIPSRPRFSGDIVLYNHNRLNGNGTHQI